MTPKSLKLKPNLRTREEWLQGARELLRDVFKQAGERVPDKVRVSCGFPSAQAFSTRRPRIGECWSDKASAGKHFEIFISPVLSDPVRVLDVLTHELTHAVVGIEAGHKNPFKKVAVAVGLTGKMTATVAGPELESRLIGYAKELGAYPHDTLSRMTNGRKKQGTRLLKAECPSCGYVIRVTRKWIEESGLPTCPCGTEFAAEEGESDED